MRITGSKVTWEIQIFVSFYREGRQGRKGRQDQSLAAPSTNRRTGSDAEEIKIKTATTKATVQYGRNQNLNTDDTDWTDQHWSRFV